jgi:serine/threonine protein kinase
MSKRPSIHDFEMGGRIGEGAYAVVRECTHKQTNERIAMKIYDKYKLRDPAKKRSVTREIGLLSRLSHQNIVKFHDAIDTNKTINLIMEHVKGKSLYSHLKSKRWRRIGEQEARGLFRQLLEGVRYLH